VRHIRAKIASLKDYLPTVNYNIIDFNVYVKQLIQELTTNGAKTEDLLPNVFEAYKVAVDKDFVMWTKTKENEYDEGKDIDPFDLMLLAQHKYKTMVADKSWAAPTKEDEKIIALEAKVKNLTKKGTPAAPGKSGKRGKRGKGKKPDEDKSGDNKGTESKDWKTKPPKPKNKDKSKTVKNKVYWWCPNHKMWCLHKASECKGLGHNPRAEGANTVTFAPGTRPAAPITPSRATALRVSSALQNIAESDDES
jgi:hypothetical protein